MDADDLPCDRGLLVHVRTDLQLLLKKLAGDMVTDKHQAQRAGIDCKHL